ncbi:MAG: hypothetical protein IKX87_13215, partial [Lachnospiraceae bacterium]|nr:hypothetical protein [Lachnospiraceae bacterium]
MLKSKIKLGFILLTFALAFLVGSKTSYALTAKDGDTEIQPSFNGPWLEREYYVGNTKIVIHLFDGNAAPSGLTVNLTADDLNNSWAPNPFTKKFEKRERKYFIIIGGAVINAELTRHDDAVILKDGTCVINNIGTEISNDEISGGAYMYPTDASGNNLYFEYDSEYENYDFFGNVRRYLELQREVYNQMVISYNTVPESAFDAILKVSGNSCVDIEIPPFVSVASDKDMYSYTTKDTFEENGNHRYRYSFPDADRTMTVSVNTPEGKVLEKVLVRDAEVQWTEKEGTYYFNINEADYADSLVAVKVIIKDAGAEEIEPEKPEEPEDPIEEPENTEPPIDKPEPKEEQPEVKPEVKEEVQPPAPAPEPEPEPEPSKPATRQETQLLRDDSKKPVPPAKEEVPETITTIGDEGDHVIVAVVPVGVDEEEIANFRKQVSETLSDLLQEISDNPEKARERVSEETYANIERALSEGKSISAKVTVESATEESIPEQDMEILKQVAVDNEITNLKIGRYLNLSIMITTEDGEKLGTYNELTEKITFTLPKPKDIVCPNGMEYVVIRVHEGVAEILPVTVNSDGSISFETDKFSSYALAVREVIDEETAKAASIDRGPGDDDIAEFAKWFLRILAFAFACGTIVILMGLTDKKKGNNR